MSLGSYFHDLTSQPGVVVVGAQGMLGVEVCGLLSKLKIPFSAVDRDEFDLTCTSAVNASALNLDGVWINCAAWTDVDSAEEHEEYALAINGGDGLKALCARIKEAGGLLVHVSTDYVFDGNASEPYKTDRERSPIGAYGRTKAAGEKVVEESGCEHIIARTSWLYSHRANNFVRTMAKLTRDKDQLRVVSDQRGRPTSAAHLAESLVRLVDANARGTFHVTDNGECSWYEFTIAIRDGLGYECLIEPCTTDEFPRPAPRPAYSVLDLSKTQATIGEMPNWQNNLKAVLGQLEPY
jgi:dTDP-4-dehydrorhamnose reductase